VADIGRVAVESVSCRALAEDAHALTNATGQTVYDALYVALAVRLDTRLITADARLAATLIGVPTLAGQVQLVHMLEELRVYRGNSEVAPVSQRSHREAVIVIRKLVSFCLTGSRGVAVSGLMSEHLRSVLWAYSTHTAGIGSCSSRETIN